MIVAVTDNPFDGLEISGPFEDFEDATSWCQRLGYDEWNIVGVASISEQSDCPVDTASILDKILDLCQEHGVVDEALNKLHCIEENGCRSSQM